MLWIAGSQAAQNKDIFVLPAFETYGSEITQEAAALADVLVSRDKVSWHDEHEPTKSVLFSTASRVGYGPARCDL